MKKMLRYVLESFWIKYYLKNYQWYRKWHGGRWEYHFIDICGSYMWLDMHPYYNWPRWRQPCSVGTPIVEDW